MGDSASKPPRKIVLLGKTGSGKSSCGNTILNDQRFTTESSPASLTAQRKKEVSMVYGRTVTVIDTPGIFDTCRDEEFIRSEIIKSIIECAPAVDAFVIVLKVEKYTKHEIEILDKIVEYCEEEIFKHAMVLFTHGEDLEGQTIKDFVKKSEKLQKLVDKCGGRCHIIDSKHWNRFRLGYRRNKTHVKNLMETIDMMVQENGCFTNELMSSVEEEIQEEMNSMDTTNLCPEEKREAAKKIVHKKILIRLAGVTTGTLIGAFLGIGVAVGSVGVLLKAPGFKEVVQAVSTAVTVAGGLTGGGAAAGAAGVEAGVAARATAGAVVVEAGVAAGATTGAVAAEAGVAAGAGIGAAASSGIAVGVIFGVAALAGAVGGGITGYKAAEEADSVLDAIKFAAKANCANAKKVVTKAEQLPSKVYKKFQ